MSILIKILNLAKLCIVLISVLLSSSHADLLNENKQNYKADFLFGNFNDKQNYLLAGVKVKLDNHWKIYWKTQVKQVCLPKLYLIKSVMYQMLICYFQNLKVLNFLI